jgi:hypothetical protein
MDDEPRIRILADYDCWAVWVLGPGDRIANVPPAEVTTSTTTQRGLELWADTYTAGLNRADPAASIEWTERERQMFVEWGRALALQVANEKQRPVDYFDGLLLRDVRIDPGA